MRRLFGPFEHDISNLYRAIFIDLDDWVATILRWAPDARMVLEVGCGEGAMTERLCAAYPNADITAIDVTPRLGRLFRGDRSRVRFVLEPVGEIAGRHAGAFDLVVLSDVLHHVPIALRGSLLSDARETLAPGGRFIFKEWVKDRGIIHWAAEASDRYLTGDDVAYMMRPEARSLVETQFGAEAIQDEHHIGPWRNNLALLVCPDGQATSLGTRLVERDT